MPIRTKLLPFSFFMDDNDMIQAYKDALIFYGLTYGLQLFGQEKYNHNIISVGEYLEKMYTKIICWSTTWFINMSYRNNDINGIFHKFKFL